VQLNRARLGLNFIANVVNEILVLFSIKYVNPSKSYERNCEIKQEFWSVATGFFLITFERLNGICPSSYLIPNFPLRSFLGYQPPKLVDSFESYRAYQTYRLYSNISHPSRAINICYDFGFCSKPIHQSLFLDNFFLTNT
jgi:hypothetical protein